MLGPGCEIVSETMRYDEIVAVEVSLELEIARFRYRIRDRLVFRDRLKHSDMWLEEIFRDTVEV